MEVNKKATIATLVGRTSRKFLRRLADHPFIAVIVKDDGSVEIFSKGVTNENIAQIRQALNKEIGE